MIDNITSAEDVSFWTSRSKKYNHLEWATQSDYLNSFLATGNFDAKDFVLDLGTGTGIIAKTISPIVQKVIGIDICPDMLQQAKNEGLSNATFLEMDAHQLDFPDEIFSKITARMVFHHILENAVQTIKECHRVLKKEGLMILSEGIPPSAHVRSFYTEMFKLKEKRITFMEEDLEALMKEGGFKNIRKIIHFSRQLSIKNWLENSNNLSLETQKQIFQMHLDLDEHGKRDYNMRITENDCLIDMKFLILTGTK